MRASSKGQKEVVKLLLDHGANTNLKDKVSVTDMIYMRDAFARLYVYCLWLPFIFVIIDVLL